MQQTLMIKTAIYSILFSAAALGAVFYTADHKMILAEDIAQNEINWYAEENVGQSTNHTNTNIEEAKMDQNVLTFEIGGTDTNYLCIPLPQGTIAETVTIENHYMEGEMWVIVQDAQSEFYETCAISGNRQRITAGTYEAVKKGVVLRFLLTDTYEFRSILEDNKLYVEFVSPRELFEKIIVVDPAFSSKTAGYEDSRLKEKEITLAIAEKLKQKLDTTDIKVYYTRMDDNYSTEEQCVKIANNTKADMLIRIETNADSDSKVYGTTAVYNEHFFIPGFGSVELANLLEKEVVSYIKGKAVGLQAAGPEDYVIMHATVPAATIKVGYLTNAQEAILLKKDDYRDKIATGIYNAIMKVYED